MILYCKLQLRLIELLLTATMKPFAMNVFVVVKKFFWLQKIVFINQRTSDIEVVIIIKSVNYTLVGLELLRPRTTEEANKSVLSFTLIITQNAFM